eukprot:jgi/Botrbrau1/15959/Bobra.0340s0007.1
MLRQGCRRLAAVALTGAVPKLSSCNTAASALRAYSSEAPKSGGSPWVLPVLGLGAVGGGLWYANANGYFGSSQPAVAGATLVGDYNAVKKAIADRLDADNYDDGSYGPVLVRLAWHCAGTYDAKTNTGGSNGATMRFAPESDHGANAGLHVAREFLEPVKKQFPWISYADLYTLAGVTAVEEMGGPEIPWRPGRSDAAGPESCPPDGRLPDASKNARHIRDIFNRMGFNDQEIVALSGAHTLGRCHADRSGYVNPWTNAPTTFSNLYFVELVNNKWKKKSWKGPLQYEDPTGTLMMLPTDMELIWDRKFKPYTAEYAKDSDKFFKDFAAAFGKLLDLGVPHTEPLVTPPPAAAAS